MLCGISLLKDVHKREQLDALNKFAREMFEKNMDSGDKWTKGHIKKFRKTLVWHHRKFGKNEKDAAYHHMHKCLCLAQPGVIEDQKILSLLTSVASIDGCNENFEELVGLIEETDGDIEARRGRGSLENVSLARFHQAIGLVEFKLNCKMAGGVLGLA